MPIRPSNQPLTWPTTTLLLLLASSLFPYTLSSDSQSDLPVLSPGELTAHLSRHRQTVLFCIHSGRQDFQEEARAFTQASRQFLVSIPDLSFALYRIPSGHDHLELYGVDWYRWSVTFVDHAVRKRYSGRGDSEYAIAEWVRVMAGFEASMIVSSLAEFQELTSRHRLLALYTGDQGSKFLTYAAAAKGLDNIVFRHSFSTELSSVIGEGVSLFKQFDDGRDTFTSDPSVENLRNFLVNSSKQLIQAYQPKDPSGDTLPRRVQQATLIIFSDSFLDPANQAFFQAARSLGDRFLYFHSTQADAAFNVDLTEGPQLVLVDKVEEEWTGVLPKYKLRGAVTVDTVRQFIEDYDNHTLEVFATSQALSEREVSASGVWTVVSQSMEEDVHRFEGAVFLMIYAPWGGHCKHFMPTLEAVAKELQGYEHPVLVAKVQGTRNELEGFQITGYPTLMFRRQKGASWEMYKGGRTPEEVISHIKASFGSSEGSHEDL